MSEISIARSRIKLVTVLGFFFVPFAVAIIGYFYFPGWFTSTATINHAPLVQPVITLKPFTNLKLDETQLTLDSLKRKWTVVHLLSGQCTDQCETALYNSRQVRLALGKDSDRVQRVIIGGDIRLLESAAKDHPDLSIALGIQGGLEHQLEPTEKHVCGERNSRVGDKVGKENIGLMAAKTRHIHLSKNDNPDGTDR